MQIIPAFRDIKQPPEPWNEQTCDLIRAKWAASIPRELCNLKLRAERRASAPRRPHINETSKQRRDRVKGRVMEMLNAGASLREIAREVGLGQTTLRDVINQNGGRRRAVRDIDKTPIAGCAGDRPTYKRGCRCPDCTEANRVYRANLKARWQA